VNVTRSDRSQVMPVLAWYRWGLYGVEDSEGEGGPGWDPHGNRERILVVRMMERE
jgi:hypothetical protein